MKDISKEFKVSSWSIDNRTFIYVMTIALALFGMLKYISLPKESFPEIVIPKIFVQTVYPGASPANMENLVTKHLEKKMKSIVGVKKITSNSYQNYSVLTIEFNTDIKIKDAKLNVKDKVDEAMKDLPNDLPQKPSVMEINLSDLPILYLNVSGNFDLNKLKGYAEKIKDRVESLKEITRVDIVGALDREIQINVDMYKMQAAQLSINDIAGAVGFENVNMSGGAVPMDGMKRTINIKKEFAQVDEVKNLIIKSPNGSPIYLKDIAEVKDGFKEQESYSRLEGKNVLTLNVVKRAGENLVEASDKIMEIVKEMKANDLPKELEVVVTGDQSEQTRTTLHDLINTIIIGFVLVTIILMFFMGATNAIFVALSVPLSMFVAFIVLSAIGFTLNMIVLFAFLLALGIVVDDAIVVIENTHRIYDNGKVGIIKAAKMAAGEVFLPVLSGTLTTLAPFIPLAFWDGVIGEFMVFLPITLMITLLASLLVAYIINPVFAVSFMKPHKEGEENNRKFTPKVKLTTIVFGALAVILYLIGIGNKGAIGLGNVVVFFWLLYICHHFFIIKWIKKFQNKTWPKVVSKYETLLNWALNHPGRMIWGTIGLFIFSIIFMGIRGPKVVFFPEGDPNFTYLYMSLPVGTDPAHTNEVLGDIEKQVINLTKSDTAIISSIISNVTIGVTDPQDEDQGQYPNRGRLSIAFVPFHKRNGASTRKVLEKIQHHFEKHRIPGTEIYVTQEQAGPPVPKPINIELTGDDLPALVRTSKRMKRYLDSLQIDGVQEIKSDFQDSKPEIVFDIDRERANREGLSAKYIGAEIRSAIFGLDFYSKFRDEEDQYPIQVRYKKDQRDDIEAVKNMKIVYRDMAMGGRIRQVPISAFADIRYENNYGGIKRKNQTRIISLSSNVASGFNPNEVVAKVEKAVAKIKVEEGVTINMAGEKAEQEAQMAFLGGALLTSILLIIIILVMQFNSVGKPIIILTEIFFSVIGVLLGVAAFKMDMSIIMTGIGIVALAGIVVRNGILLVEFADLMMAQGMGVREAILEAGKTRMTPVILTASATILGLIPLAVGLNIDFVTLFTEFNPHIFFGGDSVTFWGPLSWTMIFGLGFATFLTLILVPAMYLMHGNLKAKFKKQPHPAVNE